MRHTYRKNELATGNNIVLTQYSALYVAYEKARKKKKPSVNQQNFEKHLLENLYTLATQLVKQCWHPKGYTSFVAQKPKARQIHAPDFSDRVVHHWLVPQLEAVYEPKFIYDSYANRVGKGTHQAVQRLQSYVRKLYSGHTGKHSQSEPKGYYLQCDIANFFNSIHRPSLHALLQRHLHNLPDTVQYVCYQLLSKPIHKSNIHYKNSQQQRLAVPAHKRLENAKPDCGLPIGNLTSQFFANVYMNELEQFIKHQLKAKYYLRYVDDFVLLHPCQQTLLSWLVQIQAFLEKKLQLTLKHTPICKPVQLGIDFLGYVVFVHHTQVRRRVLANLRHKLYQRYQLAQAIQQDTATKGTRNGDIGNTEIGHNKRVTSKHSIALTQHRLMCDYFKQPCINYYLYTDIPGYKQLVSVYASYMGHIQHANHGKRLIHLYKDYPFLQGLMIKRRFSVHTWFEPQSIFLWTVPLPYAHPLLLSQQSVTDSHKEKLSQPFNSFQKITQEKYHEKPTTAQQARKKPADHTHAHNTDNEYIQLCLPF